MEIVKVFKSTTNALPEQSTPKSAAKDLRIDLLLYSVKNSYGATLINVADAVTTGNTDANSPYDIAVEEGKLALFMYPHSRVLVPSGLKIALPEGYSMDVRPRSGLALKYGITLTNTPGLVDEDYRGDVGLIIANTSEHPVIIVDGDRLGQIKISKDIPWTWEEVSSEAELGATVRGEGGFNSTGTK